MKRLTTSRSLSREGVPRQFYTLTGVKNGSVDPFGPVVLRKGHRNYGYLFRPFSVPQKEEGS